MKKMSIEMIEIADAIEIDNKNFKEFTNKGLQHIIASHITKHMLSTINEKYDWMRREQTLKDELRHDIIELINNETMNEITYHNHYVITSEHTKDSVIFKFYDTVSMIQ